MLTDHYTRMPRQLILELQDSALAIALYFFIARLWQITHQPVALSRGDIRRFDPNLKEGAVKRALDRLVAGGWLTCTMGYKTRYTPTWGRRRTGAPYEWRMGTRRTGAPTGGVGSYRIDQKLLDVFMGTLRPHDRNAHIERYFVDADGRSVPLLHLNDIGQYILFSADLPAQATPALTQWGLVDDGHACPVPDEHVVLALASQHAHPRTYQLTSAAWRRLGWPPAAAGASSDVTPAAVPLLFAPKAQIGHLIPSLIVEPIICSPAEKTQVSAPESGKSEDTPAPATMQGNLKETMQTKDSPPLSPHQTQDGGGMLAIKERKEHDYPNNATTRLLESINVHPQSIGELAEIPSEQVGGAIAFAQATPTIMSVPGWVVDALRKQRDDGWTIPQLGAARGHGAIDIEAVFDTYGDLFRRGSDIHDLVEGAGSVLESTSVPPQGARPVVRAAPVIMSESAATQALHATLCRQCSRAYHPLIRRLQVSVQAGATVIACATVADRLTACDALSGALRSVIAELGLPDTVRWTTALPPGAETSSTDPRSAALRDGSSAARGMEPPIERSP